MGYVIGLAIIVLVITLMTDKIPFAKPENLPLRIVVTVLILFIIFLILSKAGITN